MATTPPSTAAIAAFVDHVLARGSELYRDFPWRHTRDPYEVLLSEVMLQQTQVTRVVPYYERWLERFPTLEALDAAPLEAVLETWQGLGYNRRAIALKRLAEDVCATQGCALPAEESALRALPGVGPATAAGVLAFAFDAPSTYLETNVRAVFLHELFADSDEVRDREIEPLVREAMAEVERRGQSARTWYYALLDYGAHLKRSVPNPSRRSAHHTRQSPFEGSRRQKRAALLRAVMADPGYGAARYAEDLADDGIDTSPDECDTVLGELVRDGFIVAEGAGFRIA